jgi:hypothetical protein
MKAMKVKSMKERLPVKVLRGHLQFAFIAFISFPAMKAVLNPTNRGYYHFHFPAFLFIYLFQCEKKSSTPRFLRHPYNHHQHFYGTAGYPVTSRQELLGDPNFIQLFIPYISKRPCGCHRVWIFGHQNQTGIA